MCGRQRRAGAQRRINLGPLKLAEWRERTGGKIYQPREPLPIPSLLSRIPQRSQSWSIYRHVFNHGATTHRKYPQLGRQPALHTNNNYVARVRSGEAQWRQSRCREYQPSVHRAGVPLHLPHDYGLPCVPHHTWNWLPLLWSFSSQVCPLHVVPVLCSHGSCYLPVDVLGLHARVFSHCQSVYWQHG